MQSGNLAAGEASDLCRAKICNSFLRKSKESIRGNAQGWSAPLVEFEAAPCLVLLCRWLHLIADPLRRGGNTQNESPFSHFFRCFCKMYFVAHEQQGISLQPSESQRAG